MRRPIMTFARIDVHNFRCADGIRAQSPVYTSAMSPRAKPHPMPPVQSITWNESGRTVTASWRAESGAPPPKRVTLADDTMKADVAYRLASEGAALLWRGDFQNAKQLLQAMARRIDAKAARSTKVPASLRDAFNLHRQAQAQRARTLGMVLIPLDADFTIPLRRAPDVAAACAAAWGAPAKTPGAVDAAKPDSVVSLREMLGVIGAYEWRRKGVAIAALGERIHPHYGVFAPIRSEYVDLVATVDLPTPAPSLAFDIGTGTGVLAAVLAKRGIARISATDRDPRALACARDNLSRMQLDDRVQVVDADLFPAGRAPLIVCNPPWLPARPSSPLEHAVYDPDSRMLRGFLTGLAAHLAPGGEGWLILSDLAEHLELRSRESLLGWIEAARLVVAARHDVRPTHPRVTDAGDALHAARQREVTSLWRLRAA
jgi:SAM-dependent methyltransferase